MCAQGSIRFVAEGNPGTRIRKVSFLIHGSVVGTASGGPYFSVHVDLGGLGLTANTLLRAVGYDGSGNKLSFATMVIPVFRMPAWIMALFPIFGSATSYSNSYEYTFSLGEGEQDPPVEDDKLPIEIGVRHLVHRATDTLLTFTRAADGRRGERGVLH